MSAMSRVTLGSLPMRRYSTETSKVASRKHKWTLVWVLLDKDLMGNQVLPISQLLILYRSGRLTHSRTCYVHCSAGHHLLSSHQAT